MNRRELSLALFAALLHVRGHALAAEPKDEARASADIWLRKLDAADYSETWRTADDGFRAAVSAENWARAAAAVRGPLGQLKTRKEQTATFERALPGAPDGEYVVFQFLTAFDNKAQAIETVTAKHAPNGSWEITGYFIK
jgi:hypothetical protein